MPIGTFLFSLTILLILRAIALRTIGSFAAKTDTQFDDLTLRWSKGPSLLWVFALSLYIGIAISDLPGRYQRVAQQSIYIILIFSVTLVIANICEELLRIFTRRIDLSIPPGLVQGLLKITIIALGILIILSLLGVSIAPFLTALGVGGLSVALAFKDTLENLFAGIHILTDKSVRVGDFVRLETGQEGFVVDIGWRTTRLRMPSNNLIIIPNSKLSQSIVTNFFLPERKLAVPIQVSVAYASDIEKVEQALLEAARTGSKEIPGLLDQPEPNVRFHPGFGANSLEFTLVIHANEFGNIGLVQHEIRKRIYKKFMAENIEFGHTPTQFQLVTPTKHG